MARSKAWIQYQAGNNFGKHYVQRDASLEVDSHQDKWLGKQRRRISRHRANILSRRPQKRKLGNRSSGENSDWSSAHRLMGY